MDKRFKLAMERSKRSTGFMKNLAEKIGAKGKNSRSNSVDVSAILRNGTNLKNESFLNALSRTPIKG